MANSKKKKTSEEPIRQHCNLWGYSCLQEVADEISCGIHSDLLRGYFVFAWREPKVGDIKRLVVTRTDQDSWMYGIITTGWSGLIPKITKEGLYATLITDLEQQKIRQEILEDLKYFIEQ